MKLRALDISEANSYIKRILTNDPILYNLRVKGEISNFKVHSSGNVYLSLKDEKSKLNCIIFKSNYDKSLNLDNEVDELNNLKNVTYKKKIDDLQTATKYLTTAKQKYLDLASVSSDEEIQEANLEQTYAMEFLWNKVGSYATKEGVTLKWDVSSTGVNNKYTLNFTTTGSYVGVISYIYALENDSDLAFRIENFKMTASGENVTATFTVNNVAIKAETISSASSNSSSSKSSNNTNEQANTNTTVQ